MKNMEKNIERYKQAGIDKVIAEWNRQFAEGRKIKNNSLMRTIDEGK